MACVQIRAAGRQHRYQTDTPVKAAQYKASFLLYCYYLMSVILSVSSFSRCSCSLCPSAANLPLAARLFLQPQHIWAPPFFCSAIAACPLFQLTSSAWLLPSQRIAIARPVLLWWHMLLCKYWCKTNQLSWGGGKKHLESVCLDIIRTECKMCSSYTRLETYCVSCFV